jgi:hypothetical protein
MGISVAVSVRDGEQGGEKRLVFARRLRAIASTFPGRTGSVFPGNVGPQTRRFHVRFETKCLPEIILEIVPHVTSIWHPSRLPRV